MNIIVTRGQISVAIGNFYGDWRDNLPVILLAGTPVEYLPLEYDLPELPVLPADFYWSSCGDGWSCVRDDQD